MKNKKLLVVILVLAVLAVLVSAAMKKTSLFFNGDKHDEVYYVTQNVVPRDHLPSSHTA